MTPVLTEALQNVESMIDHECQRLNAEELKGLYEPIAYILSLGGKRLRPLLALLSYKHFAREQYSLDKIAPVVRAVELFHNFTLLHDDLMDDAPVRRGKPTVYKKWGQNTAILSGDAMLIEAYKVLAQLDSKALPEILHTFNDMAQKVCEGQQLDMEYEERPLNRVTIQDYLDMILLKTSYLFKGSMILGARVAGATEEELGMLGHAAEQMGLAFQVMDDYLDVFSDKPEFGKMIGGDIVEGKRTWLLLKAYQLDPNTLEHALAEEDERRRIDEVKQVYESNLVQDLALKEVERYTSSAIADLESLTTPPTEVIALFKSLVGRVV